MVDPLYFETAMHLYCIVWVILQLLSLMLIVKWIRYTLTMVRRTEFVPCDTGAVMGKS